MSHDALELLQAVYQNPDLPLNTRMRAAQAALPFERPKLAMVAQVTPGQDFSDQLWRGIERANQMRQQMKVVQVIEHEKAEVVTPPPDHSHFPSPVSRSGFSKRRF